MNHKTIIAAIAFAFAPHTWAQDPCETQNNTLEINDCASRRYGEQDRLLNAAYRALLDEMPSSNQAGVVGDSPRVLLVRAQRRWVEFRDADCKAKWQVYAGGTVRTAIYLGCMQERTEQRIKELQLTKWQGG